MIRRINNNYMDSVAGGIHFGQDENGNTLVYADSINDIEELLSFLKAVDGNRKFEDVYLVPGGNLPSYAPKTIGDYIKESEATIKRNGMPRGKVVDSIPMPLQPAAANAFKEYYATPVGQRPTQDITW